MADFRVFLSAVSSEFGSARDTLAASLRSRDLLLRVQSDFHQEAADTTLRKRHDYIRDCSAVVCIIGQRSGEMPPAVSAAPFAHMRPFGVTEASYTQWEFFFARHYRRRLSLYLATDAWTPDRPTVAGDRPRAADRGGRAGERPGLPRAGAGAGRRLHRPQAAADVAAAIQRVLVDIAGRVASLHASPNSGSSARHARNTRVLMPQATVVDA
jgi:hypothetical protein